MNASIWSNWRRRSPTASRSTGTRSNRAREPIRTARSSASCAFSRAWPPSTANTPTSCRRPRAAAETSDADAITQTAPATLGTWGDLTLVARLGGGAFGEVYQAWDPKLAREVALKLLRKRQPSEHSDVEALVINEGRLLARVRHPNVVTVFGADRFDGRVGLWMDYIKGRTLEQIVRQQGPFGADEAAVVGVDLCRALAAVHTAGLVHGDIKAQNVMREDGGRIVLMDFGSGRELAVRHLDAAGDGAGTPIYMAPELFRGAEVSVRSDIYSLGVMLDHLVTGTYPVAARTSAEVRAAHAKGERRLLRDARPDLPAAFIQAVEKASSPDPQERYASAGAMEAALAHGLDVPVAREERASKRLWLATAVVLAMFASVWVWWNTWRQPVPAGGTAVVRSLAVLPFANSAGPDEQYFSDGTTELLTARLSKIGSLKVISHTSTMRYKGTQRTPVEIAGDLKVDALLTGSIAKSGDRVRLSAQVIQAGSGQLLWAESYERALTDYLVLQSDLVRDVVRNIKVALSPDQDAALTERPPAQAGSSGCVPQRRGGDAVVFRERPEDGGRSFQTRHRAGPAVCPCLCQPRARIRAPRSGLQGDDAR